MSCFLKFKAYKHYDSISVKPAGYKLSCLPNMQITEKEIKFDFHSTHTKSIYLLHVQA